MLEHALEVASHGDATAVAQVQTYQFLTLEVCCADRLPAVVVDAELTRQLVRRQRQRLNVAATLRGRLGVTVRQ